MAASKMKTRGKGSTKTAVDAVAATVSTAPKVTLKPELINPPKVLILPEDASPDARLVTLANPRTATDTRYFCCPDKGFYELTKVSEPRTTPRSWLLIPSEDDATDKNGRNEQPLERGDDGEYSPSQGYVTKTADLFIATPIDPLFLVLPSLAPSTSAQEVKRLFLASDEYFDKMITKSPHLRGLLQKSSTQKRIEERMAAVCDTVEAGDESMYRLNETKLLEELLQKAKRMAEHGLPPSMEEKFVTKALEAPMACVKRGESSILEGSEVCDTSNTVGGGGMDSQTSASSSDSPGTLASSTSTNVTSISGTDAAAEPSRQAPSTASTVATTAAPESITHLLRLRTALNFIAGSYLPPQLQRTISTLLAQNAPAAAPATASTSTSTLSDSAIDFTPLDKHLAHLADLRQQALALRSLGDYSRKRTLDEDEETRADKKRRMDEEEKKRKAGESRGVRDLKKVNVKGMKKMSEFFAKKA